MALEVHIKKRFEKFKLDVQFEAGAGITGLLGASGCGKSMTLKCIAGILAPDEGRIVLDGRVLFDAAAHVNLSPQERHVGYLFQSYALFPNMTVAQNIAAGVPGRSERRSRVAEMMKSFRLEELEHKYPRQLSGGQQQRTALARILASRPQALLLDEPFSALDSYLRWQVELELRDLLAPFPGAVLFVTHNRDEVYRLCTSACVLDHGRSEPEQGVKELFRAPHTLSSCLLTGCKNISRARPLPDGRVEALDWGTVLAPGTPLPQRLTHVGVRSHCLSPAEGPGENTLLCRVERIIEDLLSLEILLTTPGGSGEHARLRLKLDKAVWAALGAPEALWLHIDPGDLMTLTDRWS